MNGSFQPVFGDPVIEDEESAYVGNMEPSINDEVVEDTFEKNNGLGENLKTDNNNCVGDNPSHMEKLEAREQSDGCVKNNSKKSSGLGKSGIPNPKRYKYGDISYCSDCYLMGMTKYRASSRIMRFKGRARCGESCGKGFSRLRANLGGCVAFVSGKDDVFWFCKKLNVSVLMNPGYNFCGVIQTSESMSVGDYFMAIRGNWLVSGKESTIMNIYGPHSDRKKLALWDSLERLVNSISSAWLLCGDFNEVRTSSDRLNSQFHQSRADRFNELISRNNLIEIPISGRKYTRISDDGLKFSKLDRFLDIIEAWKKPVPGSRKHCVFRDRLKNVKWALKAWSHNMFGGLDKEIENLKSMAMDWEALAEQGSLNDTDRITWPRFCCIPNRAGLSNSSVGPASSMGPVGPNPSVSYSVGQHYLGRPAIFDGYFHLSELESSNLELPFSEEEIWGAVNECASNKSPGPDGFNLRFYKKFWAIIKEDLIAAVHGFWVSGEISEGCNSSFISLIPKKTDPVSLSDYRPISLIGSFYKIIAKLLFIRLRKVIPNLVGSEQSAFIRGRNIMDGALIANESYEFLKINRMKILLFKVDFEKAFDSLNWEFLDDMMGFMGFGLKWRRWIASCLKTASISVLVNGSPTKEFKLGRGVRQVDPLSPFLFIIAAEGLNWLTKSAASNNAYSGVKIGNDNLSLTHLQYADDTLFFGAWSLDNIENLMKLLKCFELCSGLKVNYNKSNLFGVGVDKKDVEYMANTFGCMVGSFPFTYLGLPIGANMKKSGSWKPVIEKFEKRLSNWKARALSFGGRYDIDACGLEFSCSFRRMIGNGENTKFWEDVWLLDKPLKDEFKRLVRLDVNAHVSVSDQIKWDGSGIVTTWSWQREVYGRTKDELDKLEQLLSGMVMLPGKHDSWKWNLCGSGNFSTNALSRQLMKKCYPPSTLNSATHRNNMVSKKVEVFVWRAGRERLPVLVELDKRGVDLDSVLCPLCGEIVETVDHALFSCKLVRVIWEKILSWWGIASNRMNFESLQGAVSSLNCSGAGIKIWQGLVWISTYLIWKNRNQMVFKKLSWSPPVAVNDIQVKSFEWIAMRNKIKKIEWHDWLHNPQVCIL
ncbi:uncharacterized protein [Rutidosis leptorrhynchoides]|uniref:uncharacterized protein n=1 Tax=Rutidosis leptorrhynchoides TaxID=125765 RepID=UPI003A999689